MTSRPLFVEFVASCMISFYYFTVFLLKTLLLLVRVWGLPGRVGQLVVYEMLFIKVEKKRVCLACVFSYLAHFIKQIKNNLAIPSLSW